MVVLVGEIDADGAALLRSRLQGLQFRNSVILDLWDVNFIDPAGVEVLEEATRTAAAAGWSLAVVANPASDCGLALRHSEDVAVYSSRSTARASLRIS